MGFWLWLLSVESYHTEAIFDKFGKIMFCFHFCFPKAAEAVNSKMTGRRSSKLIGYVDLVIFREIWSEHIPRDR